MIPTISVGERWVKESNYVENHKEDSDDLGFAIKCLFSQSIDLNEFKLWIEQVIRYIPIEDILFIFLTWRILMGNCWYWQYCRFCFELQPIKIEKWCVDRHCFLCDRCLWSACFKRKCIKSLRETSWNLSEVSAFLSVCRSAFALNSQNAVWNDIRLSDGIFDTKQVTKRAFDGKGR